MPFTLNATADPRQILHFAKALQKNMNTSFIQQQNSSKKIIIVAAIVGFVLCLFAGSGILYLFVQIFQEPKTKVIFEPDQSRISTVTRGELEETAHILTHRWNFLGYPRVSFDVSSNGEIVGRLPADIGIQFINRTKEIGLVEFVDFGYTPVAIGTIVNTDFEYDYLPHVDDEKWHTIITNGEMDTTGVSKADNGNYLVNFILTEKGKNILADYTNQNYNSYLGIVIDKVVISAPRVSAPILDGRGVINGAFSEESARFLAADLRYPPLPIPLK